MASRLYVRLQRVRHFFGFSESQILSQTPEIFEKACRKHRALAPELEYECQKTENYIFLIYNIENMCEIIKNYTRTSICIAKFHYLKIDFLTISLFFIYF